MYDLTIFHYRTTELLEGPIRFPDEQTAARVACLILSGASRNVRIQEEYMPHGHEQGERVLYNPMSMKAARLRPVPVPVPPSGPCPESVTGYCNSRAPELHMEWCHIIRENKS